MNVGIALGLERGADAIALLNDDVVVDPGWLTPLIEDMQRADDIGSAQPTLVHSTDGRDEPDRIPAVNSAGVVIDRYGAGSDRLRDHAVADVQAEAIDIGVFTGGAVVMRRDLFDDVGVFDERFFLYYEDVELARRAARAGWRHRHVPASTVRHVGSATTGRLGDDRRRLQERNRIWSTIMHGSGTEVLSGLGLSIRRLRHQPKAAHRRALIEGMGGAPVRLVDRFRRRRQ
jgi:N-acetylglucosaminyl-diphospho-decaprenol L-rhamnosyltransferase